MGKTEPLFGIPRISILAFSFLFLSRLPVFALDLSSACTVESRTDWEAKILSCEISLELSKAGLKMPGARTEAEILLESDMPNLVKDPLFALLLDSKTTVGAAFESGLADLKGISSILENGVRGQGRFSPDLSRFVTNQSVSLIGLAALFIRHERGRAGLRVLDYKPTRPYSGILIFAKGNLPVWGEMTSSTLNPCLYPKIWNDKMEAVMERDLVDPGRLREWGMVGYSTTRDKPDFVDRVGDDPLRINAVAVFGKYRTDPVILEEDALLILSSAENKKLIAEGKVMIIN